MGWVVLALRVIFGIILAVIIGATVLFGYIAWKARARKWSGGMVGIAILCAFLFYWLILFDPFSIIPIGP